MGKYRKASGRQRLSSEIGEYRRPPYSLTRFTDGIAPFRGKSLSASVWISMFVLSFGATGVVLSLLFFAGAIR